MQSKQLQPTHRILINAYNVKSYGIKNYTKQLIIHLLKFSDISITVLTSRWNNDFFLGLQKCTKICISSRLELYFSFLSFQRFLRNFTLVHSVGNYGFLICPVPQIVTVHDTYEKVSPERFSFLKRLILAYLVKNSLEKSTGIIAVSVNTMSDIKKYYRLRNKMSRVIYSGTLHRVGKKKTSQQIIERINEGSYIFVGTMEPGKNLKTLLEAIATVKKTQPVSLKIIGPYGWNQKDIYRLVTRLGIEPEITFLGKISDEQLMDEYDRAKALVFPSHYEGFGLPVIEAMSCGCPVIAAKNSAIPEAGGKYVLYFNDRDVNSLVEKMIYLEYNKISVAEMVINGYSHADSFTWENNAIQTIDFINQISKNQ